MGIGDWGLGIGDWVFGIGKNYQKQIHYTQTTIIKIQYLRKWDFQKS